MQNRKHCLKEYFNIKDTNGVLHNGFLQSMNFSGLTFDILNDITIAIMDAYIYNKFSDIIALNQWGEYLEYDEENKEWRIDADFYSAFVNALFVELMEADKIDSSILKYNFTSLSATELKTITFGEKTINRGYDTVKVELKRGNDTTGNTARTDTETPGTVTTTDKIYPLGASDFVNDAQSISSKTQTSKTTGAVTVTNTYGDQTQTTDGRQDSEVVLTHVDQEAHTKYVFISPEKYFEIQKELASINAYTIFGNAVKYAFSAAFWG